MNANFAYRALTYQGYTKDTIYYISADTDLDMDGNGLPDDVDADATNANLQGAITTWAKDANDLFIYMIDHGGDQTFRMSATELLQAQEIDSWLDTIQGAIPGTVTLVYDACRSGSFLTHLLPPTGKDRILATSTQANQKAVFASGGTLSFSWLFWGHMFNGSSFYDSFISARTSVEMLYDQTPQIEANNNGLSNDKQDLIIAQAVKIGNETKTADDIPYIGDISPPSTLNQDSGMIYAEGVIDSDGISRVWAVISPPDYSPGSLDVPVTDFPVFDLLPVAGKDNRYEGTYEGFTSDGVYVISVYAADGYGVLSLPKQTLIRRVTVSARYISGQAVVSFAGHENVAVIDATVSLEGTDLTTATDGYGYFTLPLSEDIQPGSYSLVISRPGMSPTTEIVTLNENQGLEVGALQMAAEGSGNGDIDGDGKVGLPEAINALKVVSGVGSSE